ncbi:hypothetical protein EGW08_000784 [Elysia chlorotica]|uniref:DOMON domain-containing protein n=1 Tax=Elysia chlorotica TaxID=188477 RepID=A0A3S1CFP2_ELYCH|nr:hypothetical protein EGW08_000784 [Elysia chlorotica]
MATLTLFLVALAIGSSQAYMTFQNQIPNGNQVPHPCKANFMWPGVGHENRLGGGVNNQFGLDFKDAGYWWNEDICRADSDGDGMTNGQELGDPDCVWSPDQIPARSSDISHPGVCDPFNSPQCTLKNSFVECELEEFDCPRIKNEDVNHIDMAFLETTIPPTETNYYCMTFDLPTDQDYHVIATEPIMDNMEVLHHILVYACENDNATEIPTPRTCGMEAEDDNCGSIIGLWSVGSPGICFGDNTGYRIGKNAFKRVKLEIHYNNPMEKFGMTDKSGIRMYYQPAKSEVQDLITLTLGTNLFEIPPREPRVEVESVCKGSCTAAMVTKPAKIFAGLNHMHYLGSEMTIELFRDGRKIADISNDKMYNYDSPVIHTHTPALDLLPGDEIRTTCVYNAMNSPRHVFYGKATNDEMCFGFLFAYPKDAFAFNYCGTFGELDICDMYTGKKIQTSKGECDWGAFTHFDDNYKPWWIADTKDVCRNDGYCRDECREVIERLMKEEPCMTKEASMLVNWRLSTSEGGRRALARINGCRGAIQAGHQHGDEGGDEKGQCGWDECWGYCDQNGGPYDAAPKMAAGWVTLGLAGILLISFYS